jgi:aminoglycoside phosphotransferase (APT) family kinase protein
VLERIVGPTMLEELRLRAWTLRRNARLLARLHDLLHEIPAPPGLSTAGAGDHLLHLDLHPGNVILSTDGPFVIDWTNARRGDPALDVALTCVICATSGGPLGRVLARSFLSHFDRDPVAAAIPAAAERRLADVNVSDDERRAVRRFAHRAGMR